MTAVLALTAQEWMSRREAQDGASDYTTVHMLAREHGLDPNIVFSSRRTRKHVDQRRVVALRLHEMGWSYPRIAKALGKSDHSTIWWLLRGGRHKRA